MYSNLKRISKLISIIAIAAAFIPPASAQIHVFIQPHSWAPPDDARDIFNAGLRLYDEFKFNDAELRFREVIRRFPKNVIADRADYYLIRTMVQSGKTNEALRRINAFPRQYPKSVRLKDVEELRIQLTNEVPPKAEAILLHPLPAFPASPAPAPAPVAPGSSARLPFVFVSQNPDTELSLQQEIMGAIFRNNFDRALQIATQRLKANPVDPVVMSSLHFVASNPSAPALSMLVGIVKESPDPKARQDAIFWLGQSRGDKDAIVDTLVGLLPTLAEGDSESAAYTLSQMRTEKALNALAGIALDKSKTEKVRNSAVVWIGQSRAPNRVAMLENVYKGSMDNSKIRQQVLFALSQTRESQAVPVLSGAASSDPDLELRRQAVFWLGQSRSPDATQALEKLLQRK